MKWSLPKSHLVIARLAPDWVWARREKLKARVTVLSWLLDSCPCPLEHISIHWIGRKRQSIVSFWPVTVGQSTPWLICIWEYRYRGEGCSFQGTYGMNFESNLMAYGGNSIGKFLLTHLFYFAIRNTCISPKCIIRFPEKRKTTFK